MPLSRSSKPKKHIDNENDNMSQIHGGYAALISGGSRGIGTANEKCLASDGAAVAFTISTQRRIVNRQTVSVDQFFTTFVRLVATKKTNR
jgi:hypothetical protein